MSTLDRETLEAALVGYEHQIRTIDLKIEQLRAHLRGHVAPQSQNVPVRKRRGFSAATKKRMAAAQRKRWANKNAEAETESAEAAAPARATKKAAGKRTPMSAEARERIAAAQRKRWATAKKAAKKKQ